MDKRNFLLFAALCGLLFTLAGCGCNGMVVKRFDEKHIVPVSEFQKVEARRLKDYAAYLDKGESFPLALTINDENLEIRQKTVDVVAKQRLYFMVTFSEDLTKEEERAVENFTVEWFMALPDAEKEKFLRRFMLYLSKNAVSWAPFMEPAALKEVLGIRGGTFGLGFGMGTKEGIKATFNLSTVPVASKQ